MQLKNKTSDGDRFDRQKRIDGWPQEAIENSKLAIFGAGAIGNELIKNLMLVGFRNVLIYDFDIIEPSNLSRTVLFRQDDIGKPKAKIAAERARELALAPNTNISWFHGDVVSDIGLGDLANCDILLGCLDNVEARISINRISRRLGIPYIDSGMRELDATVSVFSGVETNAPCYECALSNQQLSDARRRYSCNNTKRDLIEADLIPTVQITAALVAALQTQEAIRILGGDRSSIGNKFIWEGIPASFRRAYLSADPSCPAHGRLGIINPSQLSARMSLGDFLEAASLQTGSPALSLDLSGDRSFVRAASCKICGRLGDIFRPLHNLYERELTCLHISGEACYRGGGIDDSTPDDVATLGVFEEIFRFSKATTGDLLHLSLIELGIPPRHIITVIDGNEREFHISLDGDETADKSHSL